ncbi:MAG TPA: hypothetical protein VE732_05865 [Nitrososphaera sp.]|nr:hypothetical protein [Nitrososphaera sp.]
MIRAQSDIALNAAQRYLSRKRPVLHVAKAHNAFFISSFLLEILDYYIEVSYAAEIAVLDEHIIYRKNYLIVALVVVQSQQG